MQYFWNGAEGCDVSYSVSNLQRLKFVLSFCNPTFIHVITFTNLGFWSPSSDFLMIFWQVWQALLAVRTLVLPPGEDIETWLKFASLCRKSGRINQARSTLVKLLQVCNVHLVYDGFFLMFTLTCVPYSLYFPFTVWSWNNSWKCSISWPTSSNACILEVPVVTWRRFKAQRGIC